MTLRIWALDAPALSAQKALGHRRAVAVLTLTCGWGTVREVVVAELPPHAATHSALRPKPTASRNLMPHTLLARQTLAGSSSASLRGAQVRPGQQHAARGSAVARFLAHAISHYSAGRPQSGPSPRRRLSTHPTRGRKDEKAITWTAATEWSRLGATGSGSCWVSFNRRATPRPDDTAARRSQTSCGVGTPVPDKLAGSVGNALAVAHQERIAARTLAVYD